MAIADDEGTDRTKFTDVADEKKESEVTATAKDEKSFRKCRKKPDVI